MDRRTAAGVAVAILALAGLVLWQAPRPTPSPPQRTARPEHVPVIPGTEAANAARVEGTPDAQELGLPPVDTAAEAEQDPCTLLALAKDKQRVSEQMLASNQDPESVEAARLRAMVERARRQVARTSARAGRRGLVCPGE